MKITSAGRVTIPRHIRDQLGLVPQTEVEWELRDDGALLKKASRDDRATTLIDQMRGRGTVLMSTDEILALTRSDS